MTAATPTTTRRPAFWRNVRVLRVTFQAVFLVAVVGLLLFLFDNVVYNLERLGIPTGFDYLRQPAGFAIPDTDFRSSQSLLDALLVGVQNTIKVALLGIVLATIIGVIVGVSRLSSNWLVRRVAALYVETFRNIPVLVIILFWYLGVMIRLPPIREGVELLDMFAISNRGIVVPWFDQVGGGLTFGDLRPHRAPRGRRGVDLADTPLRGDRAASSPRSLDGGCAAPDPRDRLRPRRPSVDARHAGDGRARPRAAASGSRRSTPRS